jgi:hypothetical protein
MRLTRFSANTLSRGRVMPTKTIARLIAVLDTQDLAPAIERLEKATGEAMEREPPEQLTVVDGLTLQLLLWEMSESMGNHDSEVVDASSVD